LEYRAEFRENIQRQLSEFGAAMVDDRLMHRALDAVRNVRGAWDLKKMTTGMYHDNLPGALRD
jgi:hypothetical protein